MKQAAAYLFFFACIFCRAQQTLIYTQYAFNKAGINPAASGTDINQKFNYTFGLGRQWVGLSNPPQQNFANFSMTIRPPRSYHFWQNVGVYLDNEESGVMSNTGAYANYTLHLLLRKTLVASFGVYAGVRTYFISNGSLDRADPLVQKGSLTTFLYPDVIPGFRLSSKKFFVDIAVRQITITQLKDFKGHKIGGPSQLKPSLFFSYGRMISLSDAFLVMPSVALNTAILNVPSIDLNTMVYYYSRFGAGFALRNLSFASAICQIKIFKTMAVGFSYSYPLNSMRYASPNSFEIMVGIAPSGMSSKASGRASVARCPALDF